MWGGGLCPLTCAGVRTNAYASCCLPCAYGDVQRFIDPNTECACLTFCVAQSLANSSAGGLIGDMERAAGGIGERVLVAQQRARLADKMGLRLPDNECLVDMCCMPCAVGQELRYIEGVRSRGGHRHMRRPSVQLMTM